MLVAKSLYEWSRSARSGLDVHGRRALKLEYGEALLRTSGSKQALEIFQSVVAEDAAEQPDGRSRNGRALFGLAQVHLQDRKPDLALPYFSRLYRESAEDSDLWWRSLLGEIRCRLALDQDAQTLYNLIRQKMVFHPQMGGPELKREFERLQAQLAEKL